MAESRDWEAGLPGNARFIHHRQEHRGLHTMMANRRITPLEMLIACLIIPTPVVAQGDPGQPEATTDAHAIGDVAILDIRLPDGVGIQGRLVLPATEPGASAPAPVRTLVIYVHGTGPGTYLTKRPLGSGKTFNYFDIRAEAFIKRGIGLFSYNKRGVTNSEVPPWFDDVDRKLFRTAVPITEADDLAAMIRALKRHDRIASARIMLLGVSEGTIIASLAAERHADLVDAIILTGYCHENMYDVIAYQFQGHGSMLTLRPVFDADGNGVISRSEYESENERISRYRNAVMQGAAFDLLDANGDGVLDAADFAIRQKAMHDMLLQCVEKSNEEWIWNNYFRVSTEWLRAHFALEPNKTRLLRLGLPIYVLHGENDAHVPADSVSDLQMRFRASGKTNLEAHVFEGHDHNLNFMEWVMKNDLPAGIRKLLDIVERFDAGQ